MWLYSEEMFKFIENLMTFLRHIPKKAGCIPQKLSTLLFTLPETNIAPQNGWLEYEY